MKSSILLLALALPLLGGAAPSRYTPARTGLQVVDGPATLNAALTYPCEEDSTKKCTGISHSEALFGVPKYGSSIQAYLYEAPAPSTDPAESACGTTKIVPDPSWASRKFFFVESFLNQNTFSFGLLLFFFVFFFKRKKILY
jgi:hypothetical protein